MKCKETLYRDAMIFCTKKCKSRNHLIYTFIAERKGFEPLDRENDQRFSRPPHSTTLASLLLL